MEENKRISDLFDRARNEAPKTSFSEVKNQLLVASAAGGAGIAASTPALKLWLKKWAATSFKFKAIVMITTLSTLTISGILIVTQLTSSAQTTETKTNELWEPSTENVDIFNEDGIKKTILFDNDNTIFEVQIDSSGKKQGLFEELALSVDEPRLFENSDYQSGESIVEAQPISVSVKEGADSLMRKTFKITQNTKIGTLNSITEQARAAGIDFDYTARVRKNIIKKIKIKMSLVGKSTEMKSTISGSKSFTYQFGWMEDDSGKAVRFINSHDKAFKK